MKRPSLSAFRDAQSAIRHALPVVLAQRASFTLDIPDVVRIHLYFGETDSTGKTPLLDEGVATEELAERLQASVRFPAFPYAHQEASVHQRHLIEELHLRARLHLVGCDLGPSVLGGFLPGRVVQMVSDPYLAKMMPESPH